MIRITVFWGTAIRITIPNTLKSPEQPKNQGAQGVFVLRNLYTMMTKKVLDVCFPVFFWLLILGFPEGEAVIRITAFWGSLRDHSDSNHCVLGHSDSNHEPNTLKSPEQPKKRGGQGVCVLRNLYTMMTKKVLNVCFTVFFWLLIFGFPEGEAVIRITAFWGSLRDHSDSNHCVLGNSDSNHDTQYTEEPRTAKKPGGPRCLCFFVLSFFFFFLIFGGFLKGKP